MSFTIDTFATAVFKRLVGKSHTTNDRDPANEPDASNFTIAAQQVWGQAIHPDPTHAENNGIVSDLVTLRLEEISGTANTGKFASYRCKLGATVPSSLVGKVNRKTGAVYAPNDYVGDIIGSSFGSAYRPKLYANGVQTPALDASDWFIDFAAGIVTQEEDSASYMKDYTNNGTLECYLYIGKTVTDVIKNIEIGASESSITFYEDQTIGNGVTGVLDGVNDTFTLDNIPDTGSLKVYVNGIRTRDYTLTDNVVTFGASTVLAMNDLPSDTELTFDYRVTGS
jgi:hypothetical protein